MSNRKSSCHFGAAPYFLLFDNVPAKVKLKLFTCSFHNNVDALVVSFSSCSCAEGVGFDSPSEHQDIITIWLEMPEENPGSSAVTDIGSSNVEIYSVIEDRQLQSPPIASVSHRIYYASQQKLFLSFVNCYKVLNCFWMFGLSCCSMATPWVQVHSWKRKVRFVGTRTERSDVLISNDFPTSLVPVLLFLSPVDVMCTYAGRAIHSLNGI